MKDLYMFGVNIAKADSNNDVYCKVSEAIKAGIVLGKKNLKINCTTVSDPKIATGPWHIKCAEEIVGDHPDDEITGVVFNTGYYDLSTVTLEERMSFMKGAMEKFGKLALYEIYNMAFRAISEPNYYIIIADLNCKSRVKFDFEKER